MAVLKCKSCGANLNFALGQTVAECEYCGTAQTIPNSDDDRKLMLLNRATELRLDNEFDKACGIYETVVAEFPDEAEAYWGLVLCKYGIEYVNLNAFKRVPTCHRTIPMPIFNDKDYKSAIELATVDSRLVYEKEAKAIDEIQKKIISIASKEEPYDIFICYKESDDATHSRTEDSTIAQDIYTELIKQGYKVFLARVTLNEVGVSDFEPYIFAALSSSRAMITVATSLNYINAVWVKNEWSRFIGMMNNDKSKHLIPCIKNFLPEELPTEFGGLQALNIGDVMFYKSLMNRINVAFADRQAKQTETVIQTPVVNAGGNPTVNSLLERAFMYLEDGNWQSADEYCEKVLDVDPKIAMAYLGKLMAELRVSKQEQLKNLAQPFDNRNNYQKIIRFADDNLKSTLENYIVYIKDRNEKARIENIYSNAVRLMNNADSENSFKSAANEFSEIKGYKDSDKLANECLEKAEIARKDAIEKAEIARKDAIYNDGVRLFNTTNEQKVKESAGYFERIKGWRDADDYLAKLPEKIENLKSEEIYNYNLRKFERSNNVTELGSAIESLKTLNGWSDSEELIQKIQTKIDNINEQGRLYREAEAERKRKQEIAQAERLKVIKAQARKELFKKILKVTVIIAIISAIVFALVNVFVIVPKKKYAQATAYLDNGEIDKAYEIFTDLKSYKDSNAKRAEIVKTNHHLAQVGDIVSFGSYEQDNVTDNGKESIEWQVISVEDDKIFVISNYILDYKPMNSKDGYAWSQCELRSWLNTTFLNSAFSAEQQSKILLTEYTTEYDSVDILENKIYILSEDEVTKYELLVTASPTDYALNTEHDKLQNNDWWTRTPVNSSCSAFRRIYKSSSYKNYFGSSYLLNNKLGVRPVMWLDISRTE